MSENLEDRLKNLIVDRLFLNIDPSDIEDQKSLINDYGVDSFNLLELVAGLEEEFEIDIDDSEFSVENFDSIKALAAFVRNKLN